MPRILWHFNAEGLPLERIDSLTSEHIPVFTGGPEELLHPEQGVRSIACFIPEVAGVEWIFGGDSHSSGIRRSARGNA